MPKVGSVNQTEPSDLHTMSLGEVSFLFWNESTSVITLPSASVRETRRPPCSQVSRRPWRSRVLPLAYPEGLRNSLTAPLASSQRSMRLFGMSLQTSERVSPNHTGPSD